MISEPNSSVIRLSQSGDLDAFKNLYRHYEKTVYGFCLRMLNNRQDAEDALQTTFIKLYRNISKFRYKARFTTYLIRISRNVCYDIMNQQKKSHKDLEDVEHPTEAMDSLRHDISKAISYLPERTRECFILYAVEGYPQNQIAEILGIRIGTVKALIFQARQKLKMWLKDEQEQTNAMS